MKLDVSLALRSPGQEFPFHVAQAIAPQDFAGETFTFDEADMEGTLIAMENGNVRMAGKLHSTAHARCANCLKPAAAPIDSEYDELFILNGDEMDDEQFSYGGSRIDLEKLATTTALLELPLRMLCRPDCHDRPEGSEQTAEDIVSLHCPEAAQTQRPFAALQHLLEQKDAQTEG